MKRYLYIGLGLLAVGLGALGVVVPGLHNMFFAEVIDGIEDAVRQDGFISKLFKRALLSAFSAQLFILAK